MAAIDTASLPSNSTADNFRSWALTIHNLILSCGFVTITTPDDMDFTTVSQSMAINDRAGFRLYAFNDTLQGTGAPVFFRLDYGAGSTIAGPGMWVSVGSSHVNGLIGSHSTPYPHTGSVTGASAGWGIHTGSIGNTWYTGSASYGQPGIQELRFQSNQGAGSSVVSASASGKGGAWLNLAMWWTTSTWPWLLSLERTKDANGNDDSRGVLFVLDQVNTGITSRFHITCIFGSQSLGDQSGRETLVNAPWQQGGIYSSSFGGGEVAQIHPVNFMGPSGPEFGSNLMLIVSTDAQPAGAATYAVVTDVFIPLYGALHCYRVMPSAFTDTAFEVGSNTLRWVLRWEV